MTIDELTQIIEETAQATLTDLRDPNNDLSRMLRIALQAMLALQRKGIAVEQPAGTRALRDDALLWKIVTSAEERQAPLPATH